MWVFISRLPLFATLVTFACVVIMFALGMWQLDRAAEKEQRLVSIQQASQAEGTTLKQVLASDIESMLDMPIKFRGLVNNKEFFLLDNKIYQGRVGYQVLAALKTDSGILIANFGWVAATNSREVLPNVVLDDKPRFYQGVISLPTHNAMVSETAIVDGNWPKVIQQIDLEVMSKHYKKSILPFVVLLDAGDDSKFVRNWQPIVMPPEKHIAYAVQWFLLALAALGIFLFAQRTKFKRNNSEFH